MIINVYIDGFNLYYGALKGSRYKWLNLERLASVIFPHDRVGRVCYFTARIQTHGGDGGPRKRQTTYLEALRTLERLDVISGTFRQRTKRGLLLHPDPSSSQIATISTWEEKKTDVNIATEMMFDAMGGVCEKIAVVTNDADLSRCLQRIRDDLNIKVFIINPSSTVNTPRELYQSATEVLRLREYHLQRSQFPHQVIGSRGRKIRKPANW